MPPSLCITHTQSSHMRDLITAAPAAGVITPVYHNQHNTPMCCQTLTGDTLLYTLTLCTQGLTTTC